MLYPIGYNTLDEKTLRFTVENHDFFDDTRTYATRYPGGLCRLHLQLENSKEVESTEFAP